MPLLVPIVEGFGEVAAVPILLRRLLAAHERWDVQVAPPKNAHGCGNLTKDGGLEKFIEYAFREQDCAGVIVLMDADDDEMCPMKLAQEFTRRIHLVGARRPVATVFARREYEAWFLASLETITGGTSPTQQFGFAADTKFEGDVEGVRAVKGWLSQHMTRGRIYKETLDQAPMTARIDIDLATKRSRSFRRFRHAIDELLTAIDLRQNTVTPLLPPHHSQEVERGGRPGARSLF